MENGWKGGEGSGDDERDDPAGGSDNESQGDENGGGGSIQAKGQKFKKGKSKTYTVRDVAMQMWATKIKDRIWDHDKLRHSDKGFIGKYGAAVTYVLEQASREEIRELEQVAAEWNDQEIAEDVQRK